APVVEAHRLAQRRERAARQRCFAPVAPRLHDQPRLVEQLIAVERLLLVPWAAADPEAQAQPFAPADRTPWLGFFGATRPVGQQGQDDAVEDVRPGLAPVLPRKEAVPGLEAGGPQRGGLVGHA